MYTLIVPYAGEFIMFPFRVSHRMSRSKKSSRSYVPRMLRREASNPLEGYSRSFAFIYGYRQVSE